MSFLRLSKPTLTFSVRTRSRLFAWPLFGFDTLEAAVLNAAVVAAAAAAAAEAEAEVCLVFGLTAP